ncbi:MAG: cytochrome c [Bryobacteraceae bacterium]|jgi:mono/diheme cytochrome c family protein
MRDENQNPEALPPLLGDPEREDVYQIHQALLEREQVEPQDGLEPTPWWVWAVSVVVIFAMGFYLGRYGGSFSTDPDELYRKSGPAQAPAASPAPSGEMVFSTVCLPCHQAAGAGLEGQFPPLAGSEWVAKDASAVVRILLDGLSGPIQVKGKSFNNTMPPIGEQLTDAEIAAVLTYVRSSWGNKAGPVDEALAKKLRGEAK